MELACPNCDTHFFVADNAIGPTGRRVRCSNCEHTWHAMPTTPSAPPPPAAAAAHPARSGDEFRWPGDTPPPASPASPEADGSVPEALTAPAPDAADATIAPDSETLAEERLEEALAQQTGYDEPKEATFEPDVVEKDPYDGGGYTSPMAAAFSTDPSAGSNRRRRGKKRMALGVLILIIVAATYFLRDQIVAAVPATARLYELAHIPVAGAEAGLEIIDVQHTAGTEGGLPVIRVTGFVVNRGTGPMTIPQIEVTLYSSDGNRYARKVFRAPQPLVDPATSAPFQYEFSGAATDIARAEATLVSASQ